MFEMFLVVAALVHQPVPGHHAAAVHSIPLVCDARSSLIVPVSVQGAAPRPFLLDTGASITTIDERLSQRLGLTMVGRIPSWTGTDPLVVAQLTVGATQLPPGPIAVADLARLSRLVGDVAGILGSDALRGMGHVTIDYDRCTLTIGANVEDLAVPGSSRRVPIEWHEGRPVVTLSGGGRLLLDSGATTVTVFSGGAAASGVSFATGAGSLVRIDRVDGSRIGRAGRLACLSIGGVNQYNVPAVGVRSWYGKDDIHAPDGLLPLGLFSRVHITRSGGYVVLVPRSH